MMEPDQIDMMTEHELRFQLRELVNELATLRAKAKAYDEGQEMMQLAYDANKMSLLVTPDNKEVVDIYTKATGYTCRKVRVCEEVCEKPALATK